jgi:hypothetical protein
MNCSECGQEGVTCDGSPEQEAHCDCEGGYRAGPGSLKTWRCECPCHGDWALPADFVQTDLDSPWERD